MNITMEPIVDINELEEELSKSLNMDFHGRDFINLFFELAENDSYYYLSWNEFTLYNLMKSYKEELEYVEDTGANPEYLTELKNKVQVLEYLKNRYPDYDHFIVHLYW